MSFDWMTDNEKELLGKIKAADDGHAIPRHYSTPRDPVVDSLVRRGLIECRRSDGFTETWWFK